MKEIFTCILFTLFIPFLAGQKTESFITESDIALFYEQGYLLKKQSFSVAEVKALSEKTTKALDRAFSEIEKLDKSFDSTCYIDGSRVVFTKKEDQTISINRINGIGGMEPNFLQIGRSEKMLRTFFSLLQTKDLEHLILQIHPKMPGDGVSYPKHRDIQFRKSFDPDWQDVLGNGSYAICLILIDPMTKENGGLWIDKSSYPTSLGEKEEIVWIEAEAGDLLFMHPYLLHGSGPNHSSLSRRVLLTGFCAFGANHKPYPGADVNMRAILQENDTLWIEKAPWKEDCCLLEGHH